ncbi:hypothetical protein DRN84_00175 [Candidatus Geothermarchaeota archaeon]|nr:MAG: hypothetical protein DRN87_02685 [Candidatus Geothermarchaeota archaeon]RLG63101.1 MAG: hypothetical protein DRN84_00175 [Candidatus Geothermarchaeota archaeon]HEW93403.1 PHP domain-containing protein [Thermoprotei archaeon]
MRLDLHIHTFYSRDAVNTIDDIIKFARLRGIDGIAITDHNRIDAALKYSKTIDEILVIPGIEVDTRYGHIILLNVHKEPPKTDNLDILKEFAEDENGIMVLAHPYASLFTKRKNVETIIHKVHAVEVANASDFKVDTNFRKLLDLAKRYNIGITAGSDSHIPDTIGYAYIEVESKEVDEIIRDIINRRCKIYYKSVSINLRMKKIFYDILHRARLYRPSPP